MAEALHLHAERAYSELASDRQRVLCERVFRAITDMSTDPRGTRRPLSLDKLCQVIGCSLEEMERVIKPFRKESRSFLTPNQNEPLYPQSVLDISHESLMRVWRRLRAWSLTEAEAAREYRRLSDRADGFYQNRLGLMHNPDLEGALNFVRVQQPTVAWADLYGGKLEQTMDFLSKSEAKQNADSHEQELVAQWNKYWQPAALTTVGLVFIVTLFKFHAQLFPQRPNRPGDLDPRALFKVGLVLLSFTLAYLVLASILRRTQRFTNRATAGLSVRLSKYGRPPSIPKAPAANPAQLLNADFPPFERRLLATAIDFFITGTFGVLGLVTLHIVGPILWAAAALLYHLATEATIGASLGMLITRTFIATFEGKRLSAFQVVKRQLTKTGFVLAWSLGWFLLFGSLNEIAYNRKPTDSQLSTSVLVSLVAISFLELIAVKLLAAAKRPNWPQSRLWSIDILSKTVVLVRPRTQTPRS